MKTRKRVQGAVWETNIFQNATILMMKILNQVHLVHTIHFQAVPILVKIIEERIWFDTQAGPVEESPKTEDRQSRKIYKGKFKDIPQKVSEHLKNLTDCSLFEDLPIPPQMPLGITLPNTFLQKRKKLTNVLVFPLRQLNESHLVAVQSRTMICQRVNARVWQNYKNEHTLTMINR